MANAAINATISNNEVVAGAAIGVPMSTVLIIVGVIFALNIVLTFFILRSRSKKKWGDHSEKTEKVEKREDKTLTALATLLGIAKPAADDAANAVKTAQLGIEAAITKAARGDIVLERLVASVAGRPLEERLSRIFGEFEPMLFEARKQMDDAHRDVGVANRLVQQRDNEITQLEQRIRKQDAEIQSLLSGTAVSDLHREKAKLEGKLEGIETGSDKGQKIADRVLDHSEKVQRSLTGAVTKVVAARVR